MGRGKAKPKTKPVSVYLPEEVAAAFDARVAEVRAQFPTLSESGYIVMLIVQDAEQKGKKKR